MAELNTLPGWKCVRQIGAGSFGKVYEIQHTEYGKVYKAALKVVRIPQDPSDLKRAYSEGMDREGATTYFRSFVENLTDEFAIMDEIKGFTNIVSYEDHMVIEHPDEIAWDILIRMELLTSLPDYCTTHTMSEKQVIQLGMDICNALEICEEKKIIHRDIKPDNIFVNDRGDFKLGDFGIARTVEKTMSGMSKKGTYDYMAPEVYLCRPYGQTVDLYSLGTMLYRFLNKNRLPFLPFGNLRPDDRTNALEQRMSGAMPQPPVNGSEQLKAVVMKSIAFDAKERYQTAAEFRQALKDCIPFIVYEGVEDAKPIDLEDPYAGSLPLRPGDYTTPPVHTLPHYEEDSGTQGGDTAPGGTIWGGTDNGPQGGGAQDTGTQGEAYPEGKTVYGDKETLLVNKKKHLPKQYIAIAAVVAAAAIGGGVLLSRPKPAPAPVSSVSAAAKTLIYAVKGKGGTLKTSEESGADSIKFEDGDELLQVTAVPDKGYKFDRWSDGYTRAERTDKPGEKTGTLYAIFVEDSASEEVKYTLRYRVSGEGGSVMAVDDATSGRQTGVIYNLSENADPVTVKAVADEGYHFVKWSDGVTDATRTDNDGESMHDVDVSAIFEKDADSDSTPSSKPKKVDPTPSPSLSPSPTPSPSPAPSPQPTPAPTPAPVAENWSMSAVSVGGGSVSITINSSSAVAVKAVLVYKANTSLQYSAGTIGNWASGTYTWTASRQGPPGDYTIRFYSASGQQMTSVDVTL
jgi:non-specific serine/threonine protein kinase